MKALSIRLTIILIVLFGCTHKTEVKSIAGKYSLNTDKLKDSIFINSNHTYTHGFHAVNDRTLECKGNWEFDSTTSEITFKNFRFFTDLGYDSLPPGNWDAIVNFTQDGKTQIIYSSEDNIYFEN